MYVGKEYNIYICAYIYIYIYASSDIILPLLPVKTSISFVYEIFVVHISPEECAFHAEQDIYILSKYIPMKFLLIAK
jgi:hypothetical protein